MSLTLFFDEELAVLPMDANGRSGRAVGNGGVRRGCGRSWLNEVDVGDVGDASGEDIMGAERAALKTGTVTVIAVVWVGWEADVSDCVSRLTCTRVYIDAHAFWIWFCVEFYGGTEMMFATTSVRGMGEGEGMSLGTITSGGQFINDWLLGNKRGRLGLLAKFVRAWGSLFSAPRLPLSSLTRTIT